MRSSHITFAIVVVLLAFLSAAGAPVPSTRPAVSRLTELVDALLPSRAYLFDESGQSELDAIGRELRDIDGREGKASDPAERERFATLRGAATEKLVHLLEGCKQLMAVSLREQRAIVERHEPIALSGDTGAVLLRITDGPGEMKGIRSEYDLAQQRDVIPLEFLIGGTTWAVIQLAGAPGGVSSLTVEFKKPGNNPAIPLILQVRAPLPARLTFSALSADTKEPLPVMVEMVWKFDGNVRRPVNAVDLSSQFEFLGRTPGPRPAKLPGALANHHWWCVPGPFDMLIPPGDWRIIVRHGLEYLPIFDEFKVKPGENVTRTYHLRRWVNMPKLGWWSGDDHVHSQMASDRDAQRLLVWAKAEDTHVANILKMSDVYRTWFEQRGFGPAFRVRDGDYVLVPGQECPRTHSDGFGHTLSLNAKRYVRDVAQYWLYDRVADTIHEQGGLFGFAHTYVLHPYIRRGMSLIATKPRVDMAEIMQAATMGTDFYYDWLNLGYKLAATAGSDAPFQGTIGEVRMYAYTGDQPFSADAWFDAVHRGRTFVSNGPMLDLHVDDAMPGDEISLKESRPLHVRARAWGDPELVVPVRLEIIRHGEVIQSVESKEADRKELLLEFDVPAGDGFWLAARAAGSDGSLAHTTPVYVVREGRRFWKFDAVPKLIEQRMANLKDVEDLVARARDMDRSGRADGNLTAQTMAQQAEPLLQRVQEARRFYRSLQEIADHERPARGSSQGHER